MALIFKYKGDVGNEFELITDGLAGFNVFHITEIRGIDPAEISLGVNVDVLESTRLEVENIAINGGFHLEEFDESESIGVTYDPPRITTFSPAKEAEGVIVSDNIVLTFSENIAKAIATGPTIQLINLTDNVVTETFAFDATNAVVATNQLTINPTSDLDAAKQYALLVDKGYITNVGATEDHGGIYDKAFYSFTTA